jgi:hypothetical protein
MATGIIVDLVTPSRRIGIGLRQAVNGSRAKLNMVLFVTVSGRGTAM